MQCVVLQPTVAAADDRHVGDCLLDGSCQPELAIDSDQRMLGSVVAVDRRKLGGPYDVRIRVRVSGRDVDHGNSQPGQHPGHLQRFVERQAEVIVGVGAEGR